MIYLMVLTLIFGIFFIFDITKLKTLNKLKDFNSYNFVYMLIFFSFLSLAGMPPLAGFVGKFLLIIYILFKNQYVLFFLFSTLNVFSIYFYIQNLRFMVKKIRSSNVCLNIAISYKNIIFLLFCSFLNIFSVFFFNDFLIIFNN